MESQTNDDKQCLRTETERARHEIDALQDQITTLQARAASTKSDASNEKQRLEA